MSILRRLSAPLLLLLILARGLAGALEAKAAGHLDPFTGTWHPTAPGSPIAEIAVHPAHERLFVTVRYAGGESWRFRLEPTRMPGIYREAASSGILSWLSSRRAGNPLEGEPLVWGRSGPGELAFYRLRIAASGSYRLEQLLLQRVDGRLRLVHRLLAHGEPIQSFETEVVP